MSKDKEYTLSNAEKEELLKQSGKQPYKMKGHQWVPMKGVGKQVCKCCGLVALSNKPTFWCIEKGCHFSDHSQYESTMKRLTKMKWSV